MHLPHGHAGEGVGKNIVEALPTADHLFEGKKTNCNRRHDQISLKNHYRTGQSQTKFSFLNGRIKWRMSILVEPVTKEFIGVIYPHDLSLYKYKTLHIPESIMYFSQNGTTSWVSSFKYNWKKKQFSFFF